MKTEMLLDSIEEAKILGVFKNICNDYSAPSKKNSLRNIIAFSSDKKNTVKQIVTRKYDFNIDDQQAERLVILIQAFLKKSEYRKRISNSNRIII